jgi:hypothetical protein
LQLKEVQAQLEKCKRALEAAESEAARRETESAEETAKLREQLEAAESARPQLLQALADALRHNADSGAEKLREMVGSLIFLPREFYKNNNLLLQLQEVHSESLERALSFVEKSGRRFSSDHIEVLRSAGTPLAPIFNSTTLTEPVCLFCCG